MFCFLLIFRQVTIERRQMTLNDYHESQAEKQNFSFPSKSVPLPRIEKPETSPVRDPTNLLVKFRDQSNLKKSSSSNLKSSTSKLNNLFHCFLKEPQHVSPNKRLSKTISHTSSTSINGQIQPQSVLKPSNNILTRKSVMENEGDYNDQQANDYELDDIRIINEHVHEYYYAIRILPGQNPRSVFIGWVTSRFKPFYRPDETSITTLQSLIRHCTIIETADDGSIVNSVQRRDAYMFSVGDLLESILDKENVARRVANGLLIGCLCDISTGQLTFYVNGKESTQKLQVEPSTKLYPAVFVEPTVKEVLQFELGRIKVTNYPLNFHRMLRFVVCIEFFTFDCSIIPQSQSRRTFYSSTTTSFTSTIISSLSLVTRSEHDCSMSTIEIIGYSRLECIRRRSRYRSLFPCLFSSSITSFSSANGSDLHPGRRSVYGYTKRRRR